MIAKAQTHKNPSSTLSADISAGLVVFLVALPLCLGIALASNAPIIAGILSGIVGGIVVGSLSGSHTSVSGPAAGLTAVVSLQIASLGSFETFLLAVFIAGAIQIFMGLLRMGFIAEYFPTSVIKGLLFAIGFILVLKQLPHLVGLDSDFEGDMAFLQADHHNTFSELLEMLTSFHEGALFVGFFSLILLLAWERFSFLKNSMIPAPLVVVILSVGVSYLFSHVLMIGIEHRVQVPVLDNFWDISALLTTPNFTGFNYSVVVAAVSLSLVASLETLLNLKAVDKIDPKQRKSPPNRELMAQGVGNMLLGLVGGIPLTSVVIRSSVNIEAGAQTKRSAIIHGFFLLSLVMLLPQTLNLIPLASLAAILIVTGIKLAHPRIVKAMWLQGPSQFVPFAVTIVAILFTDLLVGVIVGLFTAIFFILKSSVKNPMRVEIENHLGGQVKRIILPNHVSFLNKASLSHSLEHINQQEHIVIDASQTDYIDRDVLETIKDFESNQAQRHGIELSLCGFKTAYELTDSINYIDYATYELQQNAKPNQVLKLLVEGNDRVRQGKCIKRDLSRQIEATSTGQFPLAVILSCIDSRVPVELIFDLGIGDVFSIRMAGNVISEKVLGSLEFASAIAGAKLIVVMGHTKCGAVSAALDRHLDRLTPAVKNCQHLDFILADISQVASKIPTNNFNSQDDVMAHLIEENIKNSMASIRKQSSTIASLLEKGSIGMVGCLYDVTSGSVQFIDEYKPMTISDFHQENNKNISPQIV